MAGSTVVVSVLADTKRFTSGMSDAASKASVLTRGFQAAAVAIGASAVAVGAFVVGSIRAAEESQKVAAQTAAVVASTGAAAGRTAEQIGALATKLSRLTGIDDEVVQSAENMLATLTQIKGATFDRATASVLDLAQATGQDATSAAVLLGKALNDPLAGIGKLTKIGVTFSQQQKDQIANFVKLGDTAKAQGVILDEIQKEFGGSAEAFGNTFEGIKAKISNAFGNIKETIGGAFLPALSAAGQAVADIFDRITDNPKFTAFLDSLSSKVTAGLKPLSDLLAATASSDNPLATLAAGLTAIFPAFALLKGVLDGIAPIMPVIQKGFAEIGSAISGALVEYAPQLADAFGQIVTAVVPLVPQILALVPAILPIIPPLVQLATQVIPPLASLLAQVLPPAIAATSAVLSVLGPILSGIVDFANGAARAVGILSQYFAGDLGAGNAVAQIQSITGPFQGFAATAIAVGGAVGAYIGQTIANFQRFGATVSGVVGTVVGVFAGLPGAIGGALSGVAGFLVGAGQNLIGGFIKGISGAFKTVESTLRKLFGGAVDLVKSLLGIKSPSRVFASIGRYTVRGLEQGLAASNRIAPIMAGIASDVVSGYQVNLATPSVAGAGSGSASVQTGPNVNVNVALNNPVTRDPIRDLKQNVENVIAGIW